MNTIAMTTTARASEKIRGIIEAEGLRGGWMGPRALAFLTAAVAAVKTAWLAGDDAGVLFERVCACSGGGVVHGLGTYDRLWSLAMTIKYRDRHPHTIADAIDAFDGAIWWIERDLREYTERRAAVGAWS